MSNQVIDQGYGFAVYPSVFLHGYKTDKKTKTKVFAIKKQLLFGDYIKPEIDSGDFVTLTIKKKIYIKVRSRNMDGFILKDDIQPNRIVELNFIDVGQGDGCHIVTDDDKHYIVDAGATDNMLRFLKWRFNLKTSKKPPPKLKGLITHSDKDHYGGFGNLFTYQKTFKYQLEFDQIYHNGLVEASGSKVNALGTVVKIAGESYINDLCDTNSDFINRSKTANPPGLYIKSLLKSNAPKESLRFRKVLHNKGITKIEVLGPVSIKSGNKEALPIFKNDRGIDDKGKTKNGNSIILMLTIGKLKILIGGDLNSNAEDYLMRSYSGIDVPLIKSQLLDKTISNSQRASLLKKLDSAIIKSNKIIGADIVKACHHGSSDVTSEFLRATNPIATIISSGDDEPYCHPRPDTLGIIGKYGRGDRPLIFCTELARSSKEFIDLTKLKTAKKKERVVTVYGMINVRTDGLKAIISQKLERSKANSGWNINKLEWDKQANQFKSVP